VKVGDLIQYRYPPPAQLVHALRPGEGEVGTVIDFPPAVHAKEFQKVRVLTGEGIQDWIMQFCEVISESR
jgi:hypothetical protein